MYKSPVGRSVVIVMAAMRTVLGKRLNGEKEGGRSVMTERLPSSDPVRLLWWPTITHLEPITLPIVASYTAVAFDNPEQPGRAAHRIGVAPRPRAGADNDFRGVAAQGV